MSRIANTRMLYRTLSRTESRKTCRATRAIARILPIEGSRRSALHLRHEDVLERVPHGVERQHVRSGSRDPRHHLLRRYGRRQPDKEPVAADPRRLDAEIRE